MSDNPLIKQTIETTYHFANRMDIGTWLQEWLNDSKNTRIWFSDQYWLKDSPDRYEVKITRLERQ